MANVNAIGTSEMMTVEDAERLVSDSKRDLTKARDEEYRKGLLADQRRDEEFVSEFRSTHPLDMDQRIKFTNIIDDIINEWGEGYTMLETVKLCVKP